MRWNAQALSPTSDGLSGNSEGGTPGPAPVTDALLPLAGLVRSISTPEFSGVTFHEVTAKVLEGGSYEDMNREINHLVSQMNAEDLRAYLVESLFLNQVKYENDRLEQYIKKLGKK